MSASASIPTAAVTGKQAVEDLLEDEDEDFDKDDKDPDVYALLAAEEPVTSPLTCGLTVHGRHQPITLRLCMSERVCTKDPKPGPWEDSRDKNHILEDMLASWHFEWIRAMVSQPTHCTFGPQPHLQASATPPAGLRHGEPTGLRHGRLLPSLCVTSL
ncbi:hypothetical protein EYF80_054202 [Liparis tanakae]|uniref:Uncharacterized protein n=1 Tax=Liparis tanakae TaxID=230148 RepID=A0A4Z2F571_9TELE|nr:hypothetical protein EYF80_054202 [Liparis tanakae]